MFNGSWPSLLPGANQRIMRNAALDPGFWGSRLGLAPVKTLLERPIRCASIILMPVAS
jgi:hypothetical protein